MAPKDSLLAHVVLVFQACALAQETDMLSGPPDLPGAAVPVTGRPETSTSHWHLFPLLENKEPLSVLQSVAPEDRSNLIGGGKASLNFPPLMDGMCMSPPCPKYIC